MSRTDEQYTILATSEMLDAALASLKLHFEKLDADLDNKFASQLDIAKIEGIARYMRSKSKIIMETQP